MKNSNQSEFWEESYEEYIISKMGVPNAGVEKLDGGVEKSHYRSDLI